MAVEKTLIERLRYLAENDKVTWGDNPVSRTMREAADRLDELEHRISSLEK